MYIKIALLDQTIGAGQQILSHHPCSSIHVMYAATLFQSRTTVKRIFLSLVVARVQKRI